MGAHLGGELEDAPEARDVAGRVDHDHALRVCEEAAEGVDAPTLERRVGLVDAPAMSTCMRWEVVVMVVMVVMVVRGEVI